ncbi:hypothetical protein ZWY2020_045360 [Hordeum vulgare]|nr:hypothetical protein ZWY2020_045360 [Hordeum vulgare]
MRARSCEAKAEMADDSTSGNIAHNMVVHAGKEGLGNGTKIKVLALLYHTSKAEGRWVPTAWIRHTSSRRLALEASSTWRKYPIDHMYVKPLMPPYSSWQHFGCSCMLVIVSGQDMLSTTARSRAAIGRRRRSFTRTE